MTTVLTFSNRLVRQGLARSAQLAALCLFASGSAAAQSDAARPHCARVGGTVMTNFVSADTTLGTATGDLAGAASAVVVGIGPGPNGTVAFTVQHRWTTTAGDTMEVGLATAVATEIAPGMFGIVSYPVTIVGGTGRFRGATGELTNIGAVDLTTGRTVFRYAGQVCTAAPAR